MKRNEKKLGITESELIEEMVGIVNRGENIISTDYIRKISEKIISLVMEDMVETADNGNWNFDDIRLAVGRVLCQKLRINS